jgi:hypothetical protein
VGKSPDQREQDSNPGRWKKEVYYASRPAPGYLQNGAGPELRVVGDFISKKAAASKQGVQKQTWQLAFQGYSISC